jgi:catechol 2,3-dioxygenase-like lactoylglutathione lyase family enzyme
MTSIRGHVNSIAEAGALGVHSLDRFVLTVPDLKVAQDFNRAFGLEVREEGNGIGLFTFNHAHRWGAVIEGLAKKIGHLSFGAYEQEIHRFERRLQEMGIRRLDPPAGFESNGLWFRDQDGRLLEIRVAEKSSPDDKTPGRIDSAPAGARGAPFRSRAGTTRPTRLAHILLFTRDVDAAVRFYKDVLGMRLSDRSGSDIAFMHGIHGSDHHMVAFAHSEHPGLHHTSWDVGSLHDIGLGAMQMADKGYSKGWGLGRHVLGSNYFHYVQDPWGSYAEYSCDMDYIPAGTDWQAGDFGAEDAFYVWGPKPPDDFTKNKELIEA